MRFIYTLLLSLLTVSAFAQQAVVSGRVLDANNHEGEPGAIVQFFSEDQTKPIAFTSTDAEGYFSQTLSAGKTYRLTINNLGRKEQERSFTLGADGTNLGDFLLEDDKNELEGASVAAQRPLVKMEVDKMSYDVAGDVDSKSYTVLDMLRKVPMVTVDAQDNITVNGSSSFLVTVDGKPNQMLTKNAATVFKMMPASAVKSIEVITNPGVKYDAEGVGGVLNIISNTAAGGSAVADGGYGSVTLTTGTKQHHAGLMYTLQKGKFSMSINANGGYNKMKGITVGTDITRAGVLDRTVGKNTQESPFSWTDLSLSYEPDTLNLITANAGGIFYNHSVRSPFDHYTGLLTADPVLDYNRNTYTKTRAWDYNIGADWQHKFRDKPGNTFTLSYRGSLNPGKEFNRNIITSATVPAVTSISDGNTNSNQHTMQADYTLPMGNTGKLSTGLKYTTRINSSKYFTDDVRSVDYRYLNKIGAAYLEYTLTLGKVGLKAGGRYEHTWQDIKYRTVAGQDYSTDYGFFVPTASIQYSLGMTQNIGLSYNMRIERPGIGFLNPFVNVADPTHIHVGNPDLDVAKSHNVSLVYNYYNPLIMMNVTLRYGRTDNGISEYTFTDDEVLTSTYGNIVKSEVAGISWFGNINLGKTSRVYANLSANYQDLRSKVLGYTSGHWNTSAYIGAQQTIFWDLRLSENIILSPKNYQLQSWMSGFKAGVLSVAKSLLDDKLTFTLTGISNFNKGKAKFQNYSAGNGFTSMTTVRVPIRQAMFSVTWNFGKAGSAKVKKAERTIQKDDIVDKPAANEGAANGNIGF